jgi:tetratricopeptide (TPR) repeat protein
MANWLEGLSSVRVHVLVRFGLWDEIFDLRIPEDELYCVTTAMMHYGKGVALAASGQVEDASQWRELFEKSFKKVKPSRTLFNNKCTDILAVARAMLDGEIEYRRGNIETAFFHLRHAIHLDDNLPYDEPWGWMQPTRHAYGALLLEQGRVEEAAKVYAADLGVDNTLPRALRHPNNIWALQGYYECLMRMGRIDEARQIEPQLFKAVKVADVPILSSCFCRRPQLIG